MKKLLCGTRFDHSGTEGPTIVDYTAPNKSHSALLTIDVQNDFVLPDAPAEIPGTHELVPNICDLLLAFRETGLPIIHVVRLYKPDGSNVELCRRKFFEHGKRIVSPGTRGAELVSGLKLNEDVELNSPFLLAGGLQHVGKLEWIIYKPRWGAFYATRLEPHLRSLGVDTLVISGCNFPNCPRTTIYEASERDFRIVLVTDAVSGLYEQGIKEMTNIGVHLMSAAGCRNWCSGTVP
ncbi:MAG: cysteine hydrolase [Syntrophobacteraceae bacterium]